MHEQFRPLAPTWPNMDAINEASRAMKLTADKWGQVADSIMSWNMPLAFAAGALLGIIIYALLRR
jgi:hypothetical protein